MKIVWYLGWTIDRQGASAAKVQHHQNLLRFVVGQFFPLILEKEERLQQNAKADEEP